TTEGKYVGKLGKIVLITGGNSGIGLTAKLVCVFDIFNLEITISYYFSMNTDDTISQVETNKAIITRYFEAYNTKNDAIFNEIIAPDYIDHGQSAYMGSPGR